MSTTTLPDIGSELLEIALADFKSCMASDSYKCNLERWHLPTTNGPCAVCVAGAVIAKSLDTDPSFMMSPNDYHGETREKLRWISNMTIAVSDARHFRLPGRPLPNERRIPPPACEQEEVEPRLRAIIEILKARGV